MSNEKCFSKPYQKLELKKSVETKGKLQQVFLFFIGKLKIGQEAQERLEWRKRHIERRIFQRWIDQVCFLFSFWFAKERRTQNKEKGNLEKKEANPHCL